MARGVAGRMRNRNKNRHNEKFNKNPEAVVARLAKRKPIPRLVPEHHCQHCLPTVENGDGQEKFDENGYPLPKAILQAGRTIQTSVSTVTGFTADTDASCFRFLDLPAELRIRIYEFVMCRPNDVVCIPDHLLRPSKDFPDMTKILRQCSSDLICLPCQLHDLLSAGHLGLARASKQLHAETSPVSYAVNTFSVHNLYYLYAFLKIIDKPGRESLRSLRFLWRLPEEDAHALRIYTPIRETYEMLAECRSLKRLDVEVDVVNLLTWHGNGYARSPMLHYLHELRSIEVMYGLRGLTDIKIAWTHVQGLEGMEDWARTLAGYWRLPHSAPDVNAVPVDGDADMDAITNLRSIHWCIERGDAVARTSPSRDVYK